MNIPIEGVVSKLWENKHTSVAGGIYAFAEFVIPILQKWWPAKYDALEASKNPLKSLAIFYGFVMAGDAKQSAPASGEGPTAANTANAPAVQPPKTP